MVWNGKCLTADISYHKTESEYTLSDILEESVDSKYFLSQKAIERLTSYKDTKIQSGGVSNSLTAEEGHRETIGTYPIEDI